MFRRIRFFIVVCFMLLPFQINLHAQQRTESRADKQAYAEERGLIETALLTVVQAIQEATFQDTGQSIGNRLRQMATQLSGFTQTYRPAASNTHRSISQDDIVYLQEMLHMLADQLDSIRDDLVKEQEYEVADRLTPIAHGLGEAVRLIDDLARERTASTDAVTLDQGSQWLETGRYDGNEEGQTWGEAVANDESDLDELDDYSTEENRSYRDGVLGEAVDGAREGIRSGIEGAHDGIQAGLEGASEGIQAGLEGARAGVEGAREGIQAGLEGAREGIQAGVGWIRGDRDRREDDWDDRRRRRPSFDRAGYANTYIGDVGYNWPFRETALYRPIPAVRYNRVEGLVLGFGFPPLDWYDYDRNKVYGQLSYAFELKDVRYEVGLETRPVRRYRSDYGIKLGANYHHNTATDDLWKTSWVENSLAAFFFENDFLDYYDVEGWTVYAVQQLSYYAQLSAGFRSDEYGNLDRNTTWSLFGGNNFRLNPTVMEGRMQSFVVSLDGGRVNSLDYLPEGFVFRAEAEFGQGLGGDFSFNRYLGDVRAYIPLTTYSGLNIRLRGGTSEGTLPIQKQFTLGGVGSVRAYPQNRFFGTRMVLGNIEYAINDVTLFDAIVDDIQFFGFADAGWVNDISNEFDLDDVIPAAGFGVGLDDRHIRLELAWPLRDLGTGRSATLWLRLNPTF